MISQFTTPTSNIAFQDQLIMKDVMEITNMGEECNLTLWSITIGSV